MTTSNLANQLSAIKPFSLLSSSQLKEVTSEASLRNYTIGEKILRPDEMNSNVYLLLSGSVRLLATDFDNGGQLTLSKEENGFFFGQQSTYFAVKHASLYKPALHQQY